MVVGEEGEPPGGLAGYGGWGGGEEERWWGPLTFWLTAQGAL